MNTLLLKYAVEVEKTGSISKAADNLYMNQPHLSKAIRELEESLGISIFNRSPRGVVVTPKGREFLVYARKILEQIAEMEALCKDDPENQFRLQVSVPRAYLYSLVLADYVAQLPNKQIIEIDYRETNATQSVKNVVNHESSFAIIRFPAVYESYFLNQLSDQGLKAEMLWEFDPIVLMGKDHPLANQKEVLPKELSGYIELLYGDTKIPSLPASRALIEEGVKQEIKLYERGSQVDFLTKIPGSFLFTSPLSKEVLQNLSLVQKNCLLPKFRHKDVLIFKKGTHFSKEEELFLGNLRQAIAVIQEEIL